MAGALAPASIIPTGQENMMNTVASDWHALLRSSEPDRVRTCGICHQPVHAALIYQGIRIGRVLLRNIRGRPGGLQLLRLGHI